MPTATWWGMPATTDSDGDSFADACDCAPDDAAIWAPPTEVEDLMLTHAAGSTELSWTAVSGSGLGAIVYDALRSSTTVFALGPDCIESDDGSDTIATDTEDPAAPGDVFHYLVRADNACQSGTLGEATGGGERPGASCP